MQSGKPTPEQPIVTFPATGGVDLTYSDGSVVKCKDLRQAEEFLEHFQLTGQAAAEHAAGRPPAGSCSEPGVT